MDLFTRSLTVGPDEILVTVEASATRRIFGAGALFLLCAVVLWHGYSKLIDTGDGMVAIPLALAGIYGVLGFWQFTATGLLLTPTELREMVGDK